MTPSSRPGRWRLTSVRVSVARRRSLGIGAFTDLWDVLRSMSKSPPMGWSQMLNRACRTATQLWMCRRRASRGSLLPRVPLSRLRAPLQWCDGCAPDRQLERSYRLAALKFYTVSVDLIYSVGRAPARRGVARIGRAPVSKTGGCGFESRRPCSIRRIPL